MNFKLMWPFKKTGFTEGTVGLSHLIWTVLIAAEVIDELADLFSVGEKVRAITAKAMSGELDFADSLRRRVELLEGMESTVLQQVASKIPLAEGAESLFKTLNHLGYKTAIISGGFTFFGNQLKEKLGIDYVFGNQLEIKEGRLTGKLTGQIIGAEQKAKILENIAKRKHIIETNYCGRRWSK